MSEMYRAEVPQYGTLLELVADVNARTLRADPRLRAGLEQRREIDRLAIERHGAIRLGAARELFGIRRVFAVVGMYPVGYYDLSVAGCRFIPLPFARLPSRRLVAIRFGSSRPCFGST